LPVGAPATKAWSATQSSTLRCSTGNNPGSRRPAAQGLQLAGGARRVVQARRRHPHLEHQRAAAVGARLQPEHQAQSAARHGGTPTRPAEQLSSQRRALALDETRLEVGARAVGPQRLRYPSAGQLRDRRGQAPAAQVGIGLAHHVEQRRGIRAEAEDRRVDQQPVERPLALPLGARRTQALQRLPALAGAPAARPRRRHRRGERARQQSRQARIVDALLVARARQDRAAERIGVLAEPADRARAERLPAAVAEPFPRRDVVRAAAYGGADHAVPDHHVVHPAVGRVVAPACACAGKSVNSSTSATRCASWSAWAAKSTQDPTWDSEPQ
jgi:hypothetical protein